MVRRFISDFHQKVDGKGRMSIPADFRRVLEAGDPSWSEGKFPEFVVHYGDHRRPYVEAYTMEAFDEIDAKIRMMKRGSKERRMLEEYFFGHSVKLQVDETGRIVLPARVRDRLGLTNAAYFISSGDTFQIWNPADREGGGASVRDWLDAQDEDFDPLVLAGGEE